MDIILSIAAANLLSAPVLFFCLGFAATLAGSHLSFPEGASKMLAVYLMLAIGFKGGVALSEHGVGGNLLLLIGIGIALSALMPFLGYHLLSLVSSLGARERAAVAAHYGSISIVTFVAANDALMRLGLTPDGQMVAVAAAMETPAILSALWLIARRPEPVSANTQEPDDRGGALREVFLNATIVILVGAFVIGAITGERGMADLSPFIVDPFKGVLCLFLLDMGTVAARGAQSGMRFLSAGLVGYAIAMPLTGALIATAFSALVGLPVETAVLLITLAASASYIAVPAAMRLAVPDARPAVYLTLALGITFPFNLLVGIPAYIALGRLAAG